MKLEEHLSGLTNRVVVPIVVLGIFAATALQAAIFPPAKATLTHAILPLLVALAFGKWRSPLEMIFVALQLGYASWYFPLLFHDYVTEAAVLEAAGFLVATIWMFARPSPWPLLYLALYHRYRSVVFWNVFVSMTSGLGLREVPWARVYLANVFVRWELVVIALIVAFTSEELHVRSRFWFGVMDRAAVHFRLANELPYWCVRQLRLALAKR